jgi:hypothetical protein
MSLKILKNAHKCMSTKKNVGKKIEFFLGFTAMIL